MITEKILALTWKEPFATLMLAGKQETRKWPTYYRGLVLICAGQKAYSLKEQDEMMGQLYGPAIDAFIKIDKRPFWALGHAIGVARLVGCRPMKRSDEAKCFVVFNPALFVHEYEDAKRIEPIPWKGLQKWSKIPDDILGQIKFI